ncbi:hypothetical protein Q31b_55970 [Novipirellula aureliae]|uniref:Glycine zipper domain-containing protein n=1 Tax=Novipirellula aureliae TaxID=2527966 RepID=A0A5C6DGC2_9BACT|nr:glycine zipper domain-containing protein [Novipirellula aureliae]TWU34126.1 hypothetical protein Q31b_55970 [Novipirellula aureliae]
MFANNLPNNAFRCLVIAVCAVTATPSSHAQTGQQRGATLGGLAGAVAGGLIGDHNGEAGAGAAIGGVVGAVTGGLLGNANDKERAYREQQYYKQAQQSAAVATQSAVSVADVANMSRSGLSDSVIVNQINQRGVQQTLSVADIIALHQAGVRETVITAMQQAPTGIQRSAPAAQPIVQQPVIQPAPVYIQERVVVPTYVPHSYYHHRPPYRPSSRSRIKIRF